MLREDAWHRWKCCFLTRSAAAHLQAGLVFTLEDGLMKGWLPRSLHKQALDMVALLKLDDARHLQRLQDA